MKKSVKFALIALLSLSLAGCNNSKTPDPSTPKDNTGENSGDDKPVQHTFTIEFSGTAQVGETLTFTATYDNSSLTKAEIAKVSFSCDDAEAMTFTENKAVLNKAGTFKVTATYEGSTAYKDVTVEAGVELVTIKSIQNTAGTYSGKNATYPKQIKVEGLVVNTNKNGIVVYDGTALISVYASSSLEVAKTGEYVRVTGTPTRYKSSDTDERWWQFSYSDEGLAVEKLENHATIATPTEIATWALDDLKNYTTPAAGTVQLVKASVSLTDDGSHVNMYIDGYTGKSLSFYGTGFTYETGMTYDVTGYVAEAQQGKYVVMYVTDLVRTYADATGVTINDAPSQIVKGETKQLSATVAPATARQDVTWSSNAEAVGTVSATGLFTAVAAGNVTITATSTTAGILGTVTIEVLNEAIAATAIALDVTTANTKIGHTVTLTPTITPSNSTDHVTWTSSDTAVATVADGVVTGVAEGTATITATARDGVTATATITVENQYGTEAKPLSVSEAVALIADEITVNKGFSKQVATVTGVVKAAGTSKGSYYSGMTIVDTTDSSKEIYVYSYNVTSGVDAPATNDVIVITGYLQLYESTKEMSSNNSIYPTVKSTTRGTSTISLATNDNVTVTGLPTTAVNGTTVSFTVAAKTEGYNIDDVTVNSTSLKVGTDGSYSFTVAGNMNVEVKGHKDGEAATLSKTIAIANTKLTRDSSNNKVATYTEDPFTFTMTSASAITDDMLGYAQLRVYKNSTLSIATTSGYVLKAITFTTVSGNTFAGTETFTGGTFDKSTNKVTASDNATEITFVASAKQVRITQVVIDYQAVTAA